MESVAPMDILDKWLAHECIGRSTDDRLSLRAGGMIWGGRKNKDGRLVWAGASQQNCVNGNVPVIPGYSNTKPFISGLTVLTPHSRLTDSITEVARLNLICRSCV